MNVLTNPTQNPKSLQARIVSGSVVLLSGSMLVTAVNFAYNVVVARFLGPDNYGHATAIYTMLLLVSSVTLSFQIITAKVVAQQGSAATRSSVYRMLHRSSWSCGLFVGFLIVVFRQEITDYLHLPGTFLTVLLAIGAAFYVPLGTRRGWVQGAYSFRALAFNLILEGAVRLIGSIAAILLGFGVTGVIAANAAAMAIAWFAIFPKLSPSSANPLGWRYSARETSQALVFFSGQMLINNADIVLVKHFFAATDAGLYAAVAMVGRVMFAFSAAIMNSMFPVVAGARHEDRKNLSLIATSLVLVLAVGSSMALTLRLLPPSVWTAFFGTGFVIPGPHGLPYLLSLKTVVTMVFSLSVLLIAYEMAYKIANTSWIQLGFSAAVVASICRYHSSLRQVLLVQLALMFLLLLCVGIPFLVDALRHGAGTDEPGGRPVRLLRRVSEDEVISEFLRSDFDHGAYRDYHASLRALVESPNLDDPGECAKRRALLFVRHFSLWKELPRETEWYEAEIRECDLEQVRVFPRAQWLRLARGRFAITRVAELMRRRQQPNGDPFMEKIAAIRTRLTQQDHIPGSVLLIGVSESEALTIIDGNHRFVAAVLENRVQHLRFLCGLSPRMARCCWYRTNLFTLSRYGKNLLQHLIYRPETDLERLVQNSDHSDSELERLVQNSG